MTLDNQYNPILIITALPLESKIILNHHNINLKPKKLTICQPVDLVYLFEVPIGFKFDPSILNREIEDISPKLIINFGICGALDSTIPIGSPFQIQRVYHFNKELSEIQLPRIEPAFQSATLLTVDEAVLNAKRRDELRFKTGCRLVDMEAFHIARFFHKLNIPLLILKITSDFADENSLNVIKANRTKLKQSLANAYEKLITALF
jgi:nucleoside phosphorylase